MSEVLKTFDPKTCAGSHSATSLPGSGSGPMHCDRQDGMTSARCGQEAAHANLSATQAREMGLLTSGTFGQRSSISSRSADLTFSLENRLRRQLANLGSILYKMTWKGLVTPQGRYVPLLRASVRRTSGRDSTGLESRTTCAVTSAVTDSRVPNTSKGSDSTVAQTVVAKGWVTPTTRDWKDTPGMATTAGKRIRLDQLPRQAAQWVGFGVRQTGSSSSKGVVRPVEPGTFPMAPRTPTHMGRCRAYGNAIVAPLATEFIKSVIAST